MSFKLPPKKPPVFFTIIVTAIVENTVFIECVLRRDVDSGKGTPLPATTMFAVFLGINCSLWSLYTLFIWPRFLSPLRHLPQAKGGLPIFGYGPDQFISPRGQVYLQMMKDIPNDGLIRFPGFWNADSLLLTSPEGISEVLVKQTYVFTKPPGARALLKQFLSNSLVVAEDQVHKFMRKKWLPYFTFRAIHELYPILWSKAVEMVCAIEDSVPIDQRGGFVADIGAWAYRGTVDAIGAAALGTDLGSLKDPNVKDPTGILELGSVVTGTRWDTTIAFMASAFLPSFARRLIPGGINDRISGANLRLSEKSKALLAERRRRLAEKPEQGDMLSKVIQSGQFDEDEQIDFLLSVIIAGYDPTAATFSWVTYSLATYQEWQEKLREEIKANIPHRYLESSTLLFDACNILESMPVLNAVVNETIRYMPTTPLTTRRARQDTMIGDQIVPEGTRVYIVSYAINRSKDFWGPDAETWNPARWIEDGKFNNSGGATSNYAMSTFIHGPRKCIGHTYAKAEVRAFTAALVGKYSFEMANKNEPVRSAGMLAVKPRDGLTLRLRTVEAW